VQQKQIILSTPVQYFKFSRCNLKKTLTFNMADPPMDEQKQVTIKITNSTFEVWDDNGNQVARIVPQIQKGSKSGALMAALFITAQNVSLSGVIWKLTRGPEKLNASKKAFALVIAFLLLIGVKGASFGYGLGWQTSYVLQRTGSPSPDLRTTTVDKNYVASVVAPATNNMYTIIPRPTGGRIITPDDTIPVIDLPKGTSVESRRITGTPFVSSASFTLTYSAGVIDELEMVIWLAGLLDFMRGKWVWAEFRKLLVLYVGPVATVALAQAVMFVYKEKTKLAQFVHL
jgi:hypothetical protein